jgi:hypothetical protein
MQVSRMMPTMRMLLLYLSYVLGGHTYNNQPCIHLITYIDYK